MSASTNLFQLQAQMRNAGRRAESTLKDEIERAGRLTEGDAVTNVPVDTGKLRQSITYEATRNGLGAIVTANAPYAAFVEFGTGGSVLIPPGWEDVAIAFRGTGARTISMPPQPYLIPAFERQKSELENRLRTYVAALNR
jgi:HK97 gp10 family phage protein